MSSDLFKWRIALGMSAAALLLGLRPAHAAQIQCTPGNDRVFPAATQCVGTVSDVPAATLLAPYFEVDLASPTGKNTLITVNDSSATAMLAHVVIWSDLGVPVFNFNIYLTGYDTQIINMRDVLNGNLPRTASAGQDPSDTISPKGIRSQDINFASCNGSGYQNNNLFSYPVLPPAQLSADQASHLVAALTGQPSVPQGGQCAGVSHGDNIARGYVTIDGVNNCTSRFPGQPGYFAPGGVGDVTNQNNLTGEVYYTSGAYARGSNLVHIVASATQAATSTSGNYTFYGRYDAFTAADNRQPLATNFMARFMNTALAPASSNSNRVQVFDMFGNFMRQFGSSGTGPGQFNNPIGIAIRPDGSTVVLDSGNNRVEVFDANGNFVTQFGSLGSGPGQFNNPTSIAVRYDGSIFVSDTGNSRIQLFSASGNFVSSHPARGQLNNPGAIGTRVDGMLAVLDGGASLPAGGASDGASLIVWRDSKVSSGYFNCPATTGVTPDWYPLNQEAIVAFDEQEHPQALVAPPFPFGAATQMVPIGGATLPVTYTSGWIYLNLNTTVVAAGSMPPVDPAAAQGWVQVVDKLGATHPAQRLDSATSTVTSHIVP